MRRIPLLLAAVASVVAAGAAPASAGAACGGAYSAPETCSFTLGPGDTGFRLTVVADPGTYFAARARAGRVVNPVTGDPVTDPLSGEQLYLHTRTCAGGGPNGATCSTSEYVVPVGTDRTVTCELAALFGEPMSGTWTCEAI